MSEQKLHLTIDASARELQEEISRSAESIQNLGNAGMKAGKKVASSMDRAASATAKVGDSAGEAGEKVASSMDKAASATARVGDETQKATGKFEKIKAAYKKVASVVDFVVSLISKAAECTQKFFGSLTAIGAGAKDIGATVSGYQKLQAAARGSNTSFDSMKEVFKSVQAAAKQAARGNEEYIESFNNLGISADLLRNSSPEEIFDNVVSAVRSSTDSIEEQQAKLKILGETYEDVNGFIRSGFELGSTSANAVTDSAVKAAESIAQCFEQLKEIITYVIANSGIFQWLAGKVNNAMDLHRQKIALENNPYVDKSTIRKVKTEDGERYTADYLPEKELRKIRQQQADRQFAIDTQRARNEAARAAAAREQRWRQEAKEAEEAEKERQRQEAAAEKQRIKAQQEAENARTRELEQAQKAAAKELADAERTYDAATSRLDAANQQLDALEAAAREQREAARISRREAMVNKAAGRLADFGFTPRQRSHYAEVDASIAAKLAAEDAGERVRYTRDERRRIRQREKAAAELADAERSLAKTRKRQAAKAKAAEAQRMEDAKREQNAARAAQLQAAEAVSRASVRSEELLSSIDKHIANLSTRVYIVR